MSRAIPIAVVLAFAWLGAACKGDDGARRPVAPQAADPAPTSPTPPAPTPPTPTPTPPAPRPVAQDPAPEGDPAAGDDCVPECVQRNQMRAVSPEVIEEDCRRDCAAIVPDAGNE